MSHNSHFSTRYETVDLKTPDLQGDGWGVPDKSFERQLHELREGIEKLQAGLTFLDYRAKFGNLVGSAGLREFPIHRWYYYKEGFSPLLPTLIVDALGTRASRTVADPFAGVATTALALRNHYSVDRVIGVEYSPFSCFVGQVKLNSLPLDPGRLTDHLRRFGRFSTASQVKIPSLAAFHNPEIFDREVLRLLLAIRDQVRNDPKLSDAEVMFFLLGAASVIEDLSGVMKDGRALRIKRGRQRRRQGLRPLCNAVEGEGVQAAVTNQWLAMIEDLSTVSQQTPTTSTLHVRGDARALDMVRDERGEELIPEESVGLFLYSPPYLNFLDYTEVYKLELWFLELVSDQAAFRSLREGTLRSHPSITFPDRQLVADRTAPVFTVVDAITKFLIEHLARPSVGRVHGYYFDDMYEVLREQFIALEPGGAFACVVANSLLSRREKGAEGARELWRIPILTDVVIARMAEAVGFADLEIWTTRNLQAKNVNGGIARESIVVGRKRL